MYRKSITRFLLLEKMQEIFTCWKWNSKPVFNLGAESQLLLSNLINFVKGIGIDGCLWIWLDSKMLEVSSNSTFVWEITDYETSKLTISGHYIPDFIICSQVTASSLQRPGARLKLSKHQGQNKELAAPLLQSCRWTEFKVMLTSCVPKTTLLIVGREKLSNADIPRWHWHNWHWQNIKLLSILIFFVFFDKWVKTRKLSHAVFHAV